MRKATRTLVIVLASATMPGWLGNNSSAMEQPAASSACVSIGKPRPSIGYTYQHTESTGKSSRYTQHWEQLTDTGSRVRVSGAAVNQTQVNVHHIVDDVTVLDRSTKLNGNGSVIDATVFRPGIVGDPAFRACAGRSWPIPSVTATYQSAQNKASVSTPAGILKIVAIREKVGVPAGQFDTVHYIRTSQSKDEYWKSIEHGVVVKHIATLPGAMVTEVLLSLE